MVIFVVPAFVFETIGAVALPVPPVDAAYQSNPDPAAVKTGAVTPGHMAAGSVTVGAAGSALTVSVTVVLGLLQPVAICSISA